MSDDDTLTAAQKGDERAFEALVAPHRRELRAYCYRMGGSLDVADDLLQDSLLRAWRGLSSFEGRSSFRTWLYSVTWSACIDGLQGKPMRKLTTDIGPAADPSDPMPEPQPGGWIEPCPASLYEEPSTPEVRYTKRESVALAFLAALQLLPPKQRATLLACDVLGCSAQECADMLDTTVPSIQSALQRARETLDARAHRWRPKMPDENTTRDLLAKYVQAWERADVPALVSLLHADATLSMPPLPMWLQGPDAIGRSIGGMVLTPEARGAFRFVATEANGQPALGAYRRNGDVFEPAAIHVLSFEEERIASMTAFMDPRLFAKLGLPDRLDLGPG